MPAIDSSAAVRAPAAAVRHPAGAVILQRPAQALSDQRARSSIPPVPLRRLLIVDENWW
jgi:hypothetical protein